MDPSASTASADSPRSRFAHAWNSPAGRVVRLLLAALPLAWIARRIDFGGVLVRVSAVGIVTLAQGLAVQLANTALVSFRWQLLLSAYGAPRTRLPSVFYLLRTNVVANYTALLPVPLADDGVRGLRTEYAFPDARLVSYFVLVAERTIGLAGVALLAGIAFVVQPRQVTPLVANILALGIGTATVLSLLAIVAPIVLASRPAWRDRVARVPIVGSIAKVPPPRHVAGLFAPLVLSVVGHFLSALVVWWLMSHVDPRATLGTCAQMQPLVLIVMAIPLSPAGLGQRELAFAAIYGLAGISTGTAVTTSILSLALLLSQAMIGALVFGLEKATGAQVPPSVRDE